MEIKQITVGAKRSANYNTYEVSFMAELGEHEDKNEGSLNLIRELQAKARKLCNEQIALDKGKTL